MALPRRLELFQGEVPRRSSGVTSGGVGGYLSVAQGQGGEYVHGIYKDKKESLCMGYTRTGGRVCALEGQGQEGESLCMEVCASEYTTT